MVTGRVGQSCAGVGRAAKTDAITDAAARPRMRRHLIMAGLPWRRPGERSGMFRPIADGLWIQDSTDGQLAARALYQPSYRMTRGTRRGGHYGTEASCLTFAVVSCSPPTPRWRRPAQSFREAAANDIIPGSAAADPGCST